MGERNLIEHSGSSVCYSNIVLVTQKQGPKLMVCEGTGAVHSYVHSARSQCPAYMANYQRGLVDNVSGKDTDQGAEVEARFTANL